LLGAYLVSLFSDVHSKQAAAMKISILTALLILHFLVDANEAASLHRGENVKCLTHFSHFFAFPRRNAAKKRIQTPLGCPIHLPVHFGLPRS
jgi:hypothetical protein